VANIADIKVGPDGKPVFELAPPPAPELASSREEDEERVSLCEVLDRVLNKGVVLRGDIVITVADIELVYLGVELILCSVDRARRAGVRMPRDMTVPAMLPTIEARPATTSP
jgi:hypothetical protein